MTDTSHDDLGPTPPRATVVPTRAPEVVPVLTNADGSTRTAVVVDPTQVRRPWRSTLRTAVQVAIPTLLALGIVVPQVVQIILDEVGEAMPPRLRLALLGISACVVSAAAVVTRVMAIPKVEEFLRRWAPWLSAAPAAGSSSEG